MRDPSDPYAGQYDEEFTLTLSDWYHDEAPILLSQMLSTTNPNGIPPFPDAALINDSSSATLFLTPGKIYKIRVISMAAFASTMLQFDSHTMRLIEVDGVYVNTHDAYQIRVSPAQRYTFLLNAEPTNRRNFAFLASLDTNQDYTAGGATWNHNATGYIIYDTSKALPAPYVVPSWSVLDDFTLVPYDNQALLGTPDQTLTMNFTFCLDDTGIMRSVSNLQSFIPKS